MKHIMRNLGIMLSLTMLSMSCATSRELSPPRLELRKLEISLDEPSFYYHYCVKETLFGKCKLWKTERWDFTQPEVRQRLKDMGFVLQVRQKL